MVKGGCKMCGQRTTNNRYCSTCETIRDRMNRDDTDFEFTREIDDPDDRPTGVPVKCLECSNKWVRDGDACPCCGERRFRYAGKIEDGELN